MAGLESLQRGPERRLLSEGVKGRCSVRVLGYRKCQDRGTATGQNSRHGIELAQENQFCKSIVTLCCLLGAGDLVLCYRTSRETLDS